MIDVIETTLNELGKVIVSAAIPNSKDYHAEVGILSPIGARQLPLLAR